MGGHQSLRKPSTLSSRLFYHFTLLIRSLISSQSVTIFLLNLLELSFAVISPVNKDWVLRTPPWGSRRPRHSQTPIPKTRSSGPVLVHTSWPVVGQFAWPSPHNWFSGFFPPLFSSDATLYFRLGLVIWLPCFERHRCFVVDVVADACQYHSTYSV